jgi:Fe-S-cluster containining protein
MSQYAVPCNGCTLCCHRDAVRLLPADDASKYQTQPHEYMPGQLMLAHKPNGDCIYLGTHGCTIHETKPQMCREMDCRNLANAISWTQARKLQAKGAFKMTVWRRGKDLLKCQP